ncbi:MAG: VWA domain-containing protein [Candidatus Odinarchaeota archaeon]
MGLDIEAEKEPSSLIASLARSEMVKRFPSNRKLSKLSLQAIEEGDLKALAILSECIPTTVAESLNESKNLDFLERKTEEELSALYFKLGHQLSIDIKESFREILIPKLLKKAQQLYSLGLQTRLLHYQHYEPGKRWDSFLTIEKMLSLGEIKKNGGVQASYDSIVAIERDKTRRLVVLLIDKSHSVYLHMREIALLSAVLALAIQKENYSIITFDENPYFIKRISNKPKTPASIIRSCIELEASGKTDINKALIQAVNELEHAQHKRIKKIVVLLSDLIITEGSSRVLPEVRKIEDLRVIKVPHQQQTGGSDEFENGLKQQRNAIFYQLDKHVNILKLASEILYG